MEKEKGFTNLETLTDITLKGLAVLKTVQYYGGSLESTYKRELYAKALLAQKVLNDNFKAALKVLEKDIIQQGGSEKYSLQGYDVVLDATSKKYSFSLKGDAKKIKEDYNLPDEFFKAETTPLKSSALKEAWLTKSSNELQNAHDAGVIEIKETPCITVTVSKSDETISSENNNEGDQNEQ